MTGIGYPEPLIAPGIALASPRTEAPREAVAPVVVEPSRGWRVVDVAELWRSRELVFFLIWRDVKVRYKQTVLGAAWALLQPLLMMVIFSLFFARLNALPAGAAPYPLFVLAGLLLWNFFAAAVGAASLSVIASERLITKIYFPRLAVPLASLGTATVDFAVASLLLAVLMAWYGVVPGASVVLAPVVFALAAATALGLGILIFKIYKKLYLH